ncbi:hyccin-like [Mytilus edulis]|uniref:hyccin-like n=1 Tax=Mytilus edulis TaxID=6550 RepID=UPI0039EF8DD9
MADLPQAIREWLTEYKTLSQEELNTYSSTVRHNDELVSCLYHLFKSETDSQVLDPICHQLFEFYRSNQPGLRLFSLEFIPTLQWVYLSSLSVNGKKSCGGVEALLLAAYNLDIVSSDGKPKIKTFRIPSFGQPSVYHEPSALSSLSLSESALSRYDHTEPEIWRSGPYPQYEAINGQNRQSILSYLLQCYNSCISDLSELSHQMYCKACSRLATTGFDDLSDISCTVKPSASFHLQDSPPPQSKRKSHVGELLPRIAISPTLMTEMVSGLYYIMFNSDKYLATRAILDIHNRASYELFPDVLLVTTAIKNSLPAGHEEDGPMGLMTVTPSSSGHTIAKSAITNASFRTKKLPDDIDIIEGDENLSKLETIDEDSDTPTKSLGKLPKLADKFKLGIKKMDKSKVKEHKRDSDVSRTLSNGDTIDSVQVNVIKNNSRSSVDSVEMTSLTNKKNSILEEINEEKVGSSPLGNLRQKHSSSSLKEMKNKPGHTRHSSGSSVNTENCSTDL